MKAILSVTLLFHGLVIAALVPEGATAKGTRDIPRAFVVTADLRKLYNDCPDDMLSTILLKAYDAGLLILSSVERILWREKRTQRFSAAEDEDCPYESFDKVVECVMHAFDASLDSMERYLGIVGVTQTGMTEKDQRKILDTFMTNVRQAKDMITQALEQVPSKTETNTTRSRSHTCSPDPLDTIARHILDSISNVRNLLENVPTDSPESNSVSTAEDSDNCPSDYLEGVVYSVAQSKMITMKAYERATSGLVVENGTTTTERDNCTEDSLDLLMRKTVDIEKLVDQVIARFKNQEGTDNSEVRRDSDKCPRNILDLIIQTTNLVANNLLLSISHSYVLPVLEEDITNEDTFKCPVDSLDIIFWRTIEAINFFDKATKQVLSSVYFKITFPYQKLMQLSRNILEAVCRIEKVIEGTVASPLSRLETVLLEQRDWSDFFARGGGRCSNDSVTDFMNFFMKTRGLILNFTDAIENSSKGNMQIHSLDTVIWPLIYGAKLFSQVVEQVFSQLKPHPVLKRITKLLFIPEYLKSLTEINGHDFLLDPDDRESYICHPRFFVISVLERPRPDKLVIH